jgi:hypothetical protein
MAGSETGSSEQVTGSTESLASRCRLALRRPVSREATLIAVICLLDLAWTLFAIATGIAKESNPLLSVFLPYGLVTFALVKLASFLIPLSVLEWLRPKRPRLILAALRLTAVAYVVVYVVASLHVGGLL